jgi:hypothetical protein
MHNLLDPRLEGVAYDATLVARELNYPLRWNETLRVPFGDFTLNVHVPAGVCMSPEDN